MKKLFCRLLIVLHFTHVQMLNIKHATFGWIIIIIIFQIERIAASFYFRIAIKSLCFTLFRHNRFRKNSNKKRVGLQQKKNRNRFLNLFNLPSMISFMLQYLWLLFSKFTWEIWMKKVAGILWSQMNSEIYFSKFFSKNVLNFVAFEQSMWWEMGFRVQIWNDEHRIDSHSTKTYYKEIVTDCINVWIDLYAPAI